MQSECETRVQETTGHTSYPLIHDDGMEHQISGPPFG